MTGDSVDPLFTQPFIDVNEWRDKPVRELRAAAIVIRASEGDPGDSTIGFALASGGYLVESSLGSKTRYSLPDSSIQGYRTSAAVAKYSRVLAAQMYGSGRIYGYAYGGSGGGYKTISLAEMTTGIWDGVVPYISRN